MKTKRKLQNLMKKDIDNQEETRMQFTTYSCL